MKTAPDCSSSCLNCEQCDLQISLSVSSPMTVIAAPSPSFSSVLVFFNRDNYGSARRFLSDPIPSQPSSVSISRLTTAIGFVSIMLNFDMSVYFSFYSFSTVTVMAEGGGSGFVFLDPYCVFLMITRR